MPLRYRPMPYSLSQFICRRSAYLDIAMVPVPLFP